MPFRKNTDWLWENYPPDFRFSSMIFEAENVLTPKVIQTMYKIRKKIDAIRISTGETWRDLCQPLPIVKPPDLTDILNFGKRRRKRQTSKKDDDFFSSSDDFFGSDSEFFETFEEEEAQSEIPDDKLGFAEYFSSESYPDPYCGLVNGMDTACFETRYSRIDEKNG